MKDVLPELEINRLREIVRRQDEAIDVGIAALSKPGYLRRGAKDDALRPLVEARNERIRDLR